MEVVKRKISDLWVTPMNVRKHPETQIKELQRSYEMFGQYRPLVVANDGEILVGNGLFTALSRLGLDEIDCIVLPENTPEKYKKKLMLADNKTFGLGTDDTRNIDDILASMDDFVIPGFDEETLKQLYAEVESAEQSIKELFTIPEEKKESIQKVAERREAEPVISPNVAVPKPVEAVKPTEQEGSYINCPHCGAKIWGL
jgi:ParB-like chromosome segregation protein Spo0J